MIAKESQKAVDSTLGKYYPGAAKPALTQGVNLFDAFEDKTTQIAAGGKAKEDEAAN